MKGQHKKCMHRQIFAMSDSHVTTTINSSSSDITLEPEVMKLKLCSVF